MDFKFDIAKIIADVSGVCLEEVQQSIEVPADSSLGDLAFPCFKLAKSLKKAPPAIALEIKEGFKNMPEFLEEIRATGPYLNFFIKRDFYAKEILSKVYAAGANFGKSDLGGGGCVVIDYSSPNIAKPFHIGHLRSTVIGHALYNIFNFLGYKSFSINYLGDWGTQFGKVITAYKLWGSKEEVDKYGIEELTRLYVRFHEEADKAKEDKTLDDTARAWLLKMERSDQEAMQLWQWFSDISKNEYEKIYNMLGIGFDSYNGESFYNDKMQPIVDELTEKGLLIEDDGARIVDLDEHKLGVCLILRRDGGTLYATRDLASVMYRKKEYDFVKALYVTANDQSRHFAQWFKVTELMGREWAKDGLVHVPFGFMNLPAGKMSTRRGQVLLMEDLLNDSVAKIKDIIEQKNPDLKDKDIVASQVGIGAVVFNDLYNSRVKDVDFSWERMLSFEGETGPYVQYTHARCCSVLNKAGIDYADADLSKLV
ncbi:MAG: arginine--tRNA ligase, partial [Defluviitaleaceae bacterium]|nr:arginine--tRNA ligase [Defluviitaleaceae bacterium]